MKIRRPKWLAMMMISTLLFALVPAVGFATEEECGPVVVRLLAGQDIDVGSVTVTNDGETICVTYELDPWAIDAGWEITDTHLYIGQNQPPTSAPGQFPYYGAEYEDGKVTYCIPLEDIYAYKMQLNSRGRETGVMIPYGDPGVAFGDKVYIASHAVIERTEAGQLISDTFTPTLTWTRSSEENVVGVPGLGASWELATGFAIDTPIIDPEYVWDGAFDHRYFAGYSTRTDITWASWQHKNLGQTDLRRFNATFNLDQQIAANITSATLRQPDFAPDAIPINDNLYVFLNQELVFWGGTRVDALPVEFHGMAGIQAIPTYLGGGDWGGLSHTGWYLPGEFPDLETASFNPGANSFDLFAEENETGGGMSKVELVLTYSYQEEGNHFHETAWGQGERIGVNGNWFMFFEYTICEPVECVQQYVLHITSVNENTGFQHHFTIYYDAGTGTGHGIGTTSGGAISETVTAVTLVGDVLSFTATYDNSYIWYPSFTLNSNGTLTFIDGHGTDNVTSATGTWSMTNICN